MKWNDAKSYNQELSMKHVCSLRGMSDPGIYDAVMMELDPDKPDIGATEYEWEKTLTLEEKRMFFTNQETGHYSFIDGDFILDDRLEDGRYTVTLNAIETIALFRKDPRGKYLCNNGYLHIGRFLKQYAPGTTLCGHSPYPHGVMVFLAETDSSD